MQESYAYSKSQLPQTFSNDSGNYFEVQNSVSVDIFSNKSTKADSLYKVYCINCHGFAGDGNGELVIKGLYPTMGSFKKELKDLDTIRMFESIYNGRNFMGAYKETLTKQQVKLLIHYVKGFK